MNRHAFVLVALWLMAAPAAAMGFMTQPPVFPAINADPDAIAIGDLSGDGRGDVAVLTYSFSSSDPVRLLIAVQNADGTLQPPASIPYGGTSSPPPTLRLADMDGDGLLDVVVAHFNAIRVLLNRGNLAFDVRSHAIGSSVRRDMAFDDFDGDSRLDIVIGHSDWFTFVRGDGAGGFLGVSYLPGAAAFQLVDFEGDGDLDIAYQDTTSIRFRLREGNQFADQVRTTPLPFGGAASRAAFGDYNDDGHADFAVGRRVPREQGPSIALYAQWPGGQFKRDASLATYDLPDYLQFHDLDADGDLDLLAPHPGAFRTGAYENRAGVLGIEYLAESRFFEQPSRIAIGDFNGDARTDIGSVDPDLGVHLTAGNSAVVGADPALQLSLTPELVEVQVVNLGTARSTWDVLEVRLGARHGAVDVQFPRRGCERHDGPNGGVLVYCEVKALPAGGEQSARFNLIGVDRSSRNMVFADARFLNNNDDVRHGNNHATARAIVAPFVPASSTASPAPRPIQPRVPNPRR